MLPPRITINPNDLQSPRLFRRALDRELVSAVAKRVLKSATARGWLEPDGRSARKMYGKRLAPENPDYVTFLAELLALPEIETLRTDAGLAEAVTAASGFSLKPARADVLRITFPGESQGTPAHQDAWYCKIPNLWIAWIPLVACSRQTGTLEVAGRARALAAHDDRGLTENADNEDWHAVDCRPGDLLLFSGLTPHRSLANRSPDRVRLSLDLRFGLDESPA